MKLEQQIVSLELAKKLKELGVQQDSQWYRKEMLGVWHTGDSLEIKDGEIQNQNKPESKSFIMNCNMVTPEDLNFDTVSAYTVAELGEILPTSIDVKEKGGGEIFKLAIWRHLNKWSVFYGGQDYCLCSFEDETEADARAKMLIYLLENNLIQL